MVGWTSDGTGVQRRMLQQKDPRISVDQRDRENWLGSEGAFQEFRELGGSAHLDAERRD